MPRVLARGRRTGWQTALPFMAASSTRPPALSLVDLPYGRCDRAQYKSKVSRSLIEGVLPQACPARRPDRKQLAA